MTGACPRCGAPWSGEVSCRQCGLLLGTPPPPPPPPPPPIDPEDRPDVWARRGGLGSAVLGIGLLLLGLGGVALVSRGGASATITTILAIWCVLSLVGIVEGVRAWRGNLAAAIRVGIVDAVFGVFLVWLASITHLGGERLWGDADSTLKDMFMLLGFVALIAAAEAIIGAMVARSRMPAR